MHSKKQRLLKKFLLPLLLLPVLFAGFSCGGNKGPDVEVCIFRSQERGFRCSHFPNRDPRFISFESEVSLPEKLRQSCMKSAMVEKFVKSCKAGKLLPVELCQLKLDMTALTCKFPDGANFELPIAEADKYVCLNQIDYDRTTERCR
jgi:hypothetical protein